MWCCRNDILLYDSFYYAVTHVAHIIFSQHKSTLVAKQTY